MFGDAYLARSPPGFLPEREAIRQARGEAGDALAGGDDDVGNRGVVVRRHDVAAGHPRDGGELFDDLDADAAAFDDRIGGVLHAVDKGLRDDGAEQLFADPIRRFRRAQRHDPDEDEKLVGEAVLGKPRDVAAHHAGIHAELGLRELRAGGDLGGQALRLPAGLRIDRAVGGAEEERRRACDLAAGRQFALVAQTARGFQEHARVDIEHRLGVGLVAGARIVAAQHQEVADAERRGAQQVALQRDAVAVAASDLHDRLDALLDQDRGGGERREMRAGAGAVCEIDGIGQPLERPRLGHEFVTVGRNRGVTSAVMTKRFDLSLSCRFMPSTHQNPVDVASITIHRHEDMPWARSRNGGRRTIGNGVTDEIAGRGA